MMEPKFFLAYVWFFIAVINLLFNSSKDKMLVFYSALILSNIWATA